VVDYNFKTRKMKAARVTAVQIGITNLSKDSPAMFDTRRVTVGAPARLPSSLPARSPTRLLASKPVQIECTGGHFLMHVSHPPSRQPNNPLAAQSVVRHFKYNPSTLANDIALLVLDRPATIRPVALAGAGMKLRDGEGLLAAGWGDTDKMPYTDVMQLMWVLMPLLSNKECDDLVSEYIGRTPASHICAGEWRRQRMQAAAAGSGCRQRQDCSAACPRSVQEAST
jgi:hypothetical protein